MVRVSIVVPVLNEAPIIRQFLTHLRANACTAEIIVVDGGSADETLTLCQELADRILQSDPGRAQQMNRGAEIAAGEVLWFVHADSRISEGSLAAIDHALAKRNVVGGCFRLRIFPSRWIYRIRDAVGDACVGVFGIALGDRGVFCRRGNFRAVGGYPEQPILEDADFYRRLRATGGVTLLSHSIETSARRYEALGPFRTSVFYAFIMALYVLRVPMSILQRLVQIYSRKQAGQTRLPSDN